jgi:hypothetical protein
MIKLAKGPRSLTSQIGSGLGTDSPPWDTLQVQAKAVVEGANGLAKNSPPRGSNDSWTKLTAAFVTAATDLEKATQGKNKEKALDAHRTIQDSCKACHREHRK